MAAQKLQDISASLTPADAEPTTAGQSKRAQAGGAAQPSPQSNTSESLRPLKRRILEQSSSITDRQQRAADPSDSSASEAHAIPQHCAAAGL